VIAVTGIGYTALTHCCAACGRRWRTVYQVTPASDGAHPQVRYRRDDVGDVDPYCDERCRICGGIAQVVATPWVVPQPRGGRTEPARP
jgi:hypothetical protein